MMYVISTSDRKLLWLSEAGSRYMFTPRLQKAMLFVSEGHAKKYLKGLRAGRNVKLKHAVIVPAEVVL